MRRVLVLLCISILQLSQAIASPALTSFATTMRARPSPRAPVIQAIPSNAEIDLSNCGRSWCFVSWRNQVGYVTANSVVALPDAPPEEVYAAPPLVVAPYYGWGWGRPYGWGWGPGYGGRWRR
jgi:hypothetical protein